MEVRKTIAGIIGRFQRWYHAIVPPAPLTEEQQFQALKNELAAVCKRVVDKAAEAEMSKLIGDMQVAVDGLNSIESHYKLHLEFGETKEQVAYLAQDFVTLMQNAVATQDAIYGQLRELNAEEKRLVAALRSQKLYQKQRNEVIAIIKEARDKLLPVRKFTNITIPLRTAARAAHSNSAWRTEKNGNGFNDCLLKEVVAYLEERAKI